MSFIEGAAGAGAGVVPHNNVRNMNSRQQTGFTDFNDRNENAVRTGKVQKTDFGYPSKAQPHEQVAKAGSKDGLEVSNPVNRVSRQENSGTPDPGQGNAGPPMTGVMRNANQELTGAVQALNGREENQMQAAPMQGGLASNYHAGIGSGFSGMSGGMTQAMGQGSYLNIMI